MDMLKMIFLQLWWTLVMILTGSDGMTPLTQSSENNAAVSLEEVGKSPKLLDFHRAMEEARNDLHEIKSSYGKSSEELDGLSIDDMLASFAEPNDAAAEEDDKALQAAADAWFLEFQAAQLAEKQVEPTEERERRGINKNYQTEFEKALEKTEIAKVKQKYKDTNPDVLAMKAKNSRKESFSSSPTALDIKLKRVQQVLDQQENANSKRRPVSQAHKLDSDESNSWKSKSSEENVSDGVYEQTLARLNRPRIHETRNSLAHEANYKLSKIEQEASEDARKKVSYPNNLDKRSIDFNPIDEIKLKTSNRLMLKGMGASLPSNSLADTRRDHLVDELIKERERGLVKQRQMEDKQLRDIPDPRDYEAEALVEYTKFDATHPLNSLNSIDSMMPASSLDSTNSISSDLETQKNYDFFSSNYDPFNNMHSAHLPNMRDFARSKREQEFEKAPTELEAKQSELFSDDREIKDSDSVNEKLSLPLADSIGIDAAAEKELKHEDDVKLHESIDEQFHMPLKMDDKLDDKSGLKRAQLAVKVDVDGGHQTDNGDMKIEDHVVLMDSDPKLSKSLFNIDNNAKLVHEQAETDMKSQALHMNAESNGRSEDNNIKLNIKLNMEDEKPISLGNVKKMSNEHTISSHPDAVVKLLASEISQHGEMSRGKRYAKHPYHRKLHRQRRSLSDEPHKRRKRSVLESPRSELLDDFEDHNGNRVLLGNLGNGVLTASAHDNVKSIKKASDLHYPRHHLLIDLNDAGNTHGQKDWNADSQLVDVRDNSHQQFMAPMMHNRNNNQMQMQQQQPMVYPYQHPIQQVQPVVYPQQQHPQQTQSNFKASFNLTNFLNEIAKLQKIHEGGQMMPQQQAMQQPQIMNTNQKVYANQFKNQQQIRPSPIYGSQRYFGPLANKPNPQPMQPASNTVIKSTMWTDPCLTSIPPGELSTTTEVAQTALNPAISTINPDCIPITGTVPGSSTAATEAGVTTTTVVPPTPNDTMSSFCNNPDMMKLNVSINANVCGDPKTKQFYGNGSISMQPGMKDAKYNENNQMNFVYDSENKHEDGSNVVAGKDDLPLVKTRRSLRHSGGIEDHEVPLNDQGKDEEDEKNERGDRVEKEEKEEKEEKGGRGDNNAKNEKGKKIDKQKKSKATSKQKNKKRKSQKQTAKEKDSKNARQEEENDRHTQNANGRRDPNSDSFEKLISGKLSEEIVEAVFDEVNNDPHFESLISVLGRNRKASQKGTKSFYQLSKEDHDHRLEKAEEMIKEAMDAISEIIDRQLRERACIPLRPDLIGFYDVITKNMKEQEMCREKREKRETMMSSLSSTDNFSTNVRAMDPNRIEEKSRIVKKLLRQYEELPQEDQQAVAHIRDELLMDLIYIRNIVDAVERTRRNAQLEEVLDKTRRNPNAEEDLHGEYSSRFIKLLKTSELFKESGSQQQKLLV